MILKASQRGGGKQLAIHLLRTDENEHVEVHEVSGFVAQDVMGAMAEAYAVSKGTRCKQHLFSVSLKACRRAISNRPSKSAGRYRIPSRVSLRRWKSVA